MEDNKVFIDTTPIIYLLDDTPASEKVWHTLNKFAGRDAIFKTSVVTVAQILNYFRRKENFSAIELFWEMIESAPVEILLITKEVAIDATKILQGCDLTLEQSFQLACAFSNGCNVFITYDQKLQEFLKNIPTGA